MEGSNPSPLFGTLRARLEYWVRFWAPQYQTDIDVLEQVQRMAVKMLEGLEHKKKLRDQGLFKVLGVLIAVYNCLTLGGLQENGARPFSEVYKDKRKVSRHKLQ